jgi:hypothetical protein
MYFFVIGELLKLIFIEAGEMSEYGPFINKLKLLTFQLVAYLGAF